MTATRESKQKAERAVVGDGRATIAAFKEMDSGCMFGPSFFLGQLGYFVRERCPSPEEGLPLVQIGLLDGELLDICHIVAVSPRWVMFAVPESERPSSAMATEFVPYELIRRVSIRSRSGEASTIGFEQAEAPRVAIDVPQR